MPHIFISYAKKDTRALAEALVAALNALPGISAWMDMSLEADSSWAGQIQHEIDRCDYVVVLLSPDVHRAETVTQRRSFVLTEIDYAQQEHKPILPVMVQPTKMPLQLAGIQYLDLTQSPDNPDPIINRVHRRFNVVSTPSLAPSSTLQGKTRPLSRMMLVMGGVTLIVIAIPLIAVLKSLLPYANSAAQQTVLSATVTPEPIVSTTLTPTLDLMTQIYLTFAVDFTATPTPTSVPTDNLTATYAQVRRETVATLTANFHNPTPTVIGGGQGIIAFTSDQDGDQEIYTFDIRNSTPTQLTQNNQRDYAPVWSPDGQRIAFLSDRDTVTGIYIMNSDGSNQRRLTDYGIEDRRFAWSPDGSTIAFISLRDGESELYTIGIDGLEPSRLTNSTCYKNYPAWYPDGRHIAFITNCSGFYDIYLVDVDARNVRRLTAGSADVSEFAWSPNVAALAFVSTESGQAEIYTMSMLDSTVYQLTAGGSGSNRYPSWSPDGTRIAYSSNEARTYDIYVMDSDGSSSRVLISNDHSDEVEPAWQP